MDPGGNGSDGSEATFHTFWKEERSDGLWPEDSRQQGRGLCFRTSGPEGGHTRTRASPGPAGTPS